MKRLKKRLKEVWRFLGEDLWDIELTSLSGWRRRGIKALRVVELVFRGFRQDECPLHASALTFSTLMSIVPVLALSLALARGLGDTETARERIRGAVREWSQGFGKPLIGGASAQEEASPERAPETEEASVSAGGVAAVAATNAIPVVIEPSALADQLDMIIVAGFEKVGNISFTALGGVGLLLLLWMVIQVLGRVEASFNRVWGVSQDRTLWRKFTDYLSILLILPVLALAASSVPVVDFATRFLDEETAGILKDIVGSGLLKVASVVVLSTLCFAFVIIFMPNTKVHFGPGLVGGLVTALLFLLWLKGCAALQVGVAKWGKIYGSFAVVPIVLAWVYVSWQIVFFGAEVAFAVQNGSTYRMEQGAGKANVKARVLLALSVVAEAARGMMGSGPRFDMAAFAKEKRVPVRFLNDVMQELVRTGLMAELSERQGAYVLLASPDRLAVAEVIRAVIHAGVEPEALGLQSVNEHIRALVERVAEGLSGGVADMTIADLLAKAGGTASA